MAAIKTKQTKRAQLQQYLAEAGPQQITEADQKELRRRLAPITERYLRGLLRETGIPLDPMVEGIRQDSLEELERTLLAMGEEYERRRARGDREGAGACRREVITAKDHARLATARLSGAPEAKARKEEMVSWMLVWLENPELFPTWVGLRKKRLAETAE